MKCKPLTAGFLAVLIAGCANIGKIGEHDSNYAHIVRMERDGVARNMSTGERMDIGEFENGQLKKIMSSIQENKKLESIVVYVHGAPLMGDVTVKETESKLRMIKSGDTTIHPILFNWDGSLGDVYGDHLFRVRNGQEISKPRGFATAPAYAFADFVAAIGIAPGIWAEHSERIAEVEYPGLDMSGEKAESEQRQLVALTPKRENSEVLKEKTKNGDCETSFQISKTMRHEPGISVGTAVDVLRSIPILLTSSFLVSGGRSAWKNYHRRTHVAVRGAREFNTADHNAQVYDETPTGMFAVLMDRILKEIDNGKIKVVMIGHSTGTMILTEYLATLVQRSNAEELVEGTKKITDIVFLGAASTVGDTSKAIFPFLQMSKDSNFSNISLNAYHEDKSTWGGVLLTGSMLEWLDNSIAQPASQLDRVIGKWENVMLTMHTIPCDIRDRVHLVHLPKMKGYPEKHGELDDISAKFHPFREPSWRVDATAE